MQVEQTITLNEKQIGDILIKALNLNSDTRVSFSHYEGDQRDPSYTNVRITSKTNIENKTVAQPTWHPNGHGGGDWR